MILPVVAGTASGTDGAPSEPAVTLGVRRNLTCSEAGGLRNQTVHTQWNCLLSRTINGSEIVPGPLRVNGERYTTL